MTESLSRSEVIEDLASALGVPAAEITEELDVFDGGLDSVRMMGLVEKWRDAGHPDIDFPTLAAEPTVGAWLAKLGVAA